MVIVEPTPPAEQAIREQAYLLWEQHGRPAGRDLEFWLRATAMLSAVKPPALQSAPAKAPRGKIIASKPAPKTRAKSAA